MTPRPKTGCVHPDEFLATFFCLRAQKRVRFAESPEAEPETELQRWQHAMQEGEELEARAVRWLNNLPEDPKLREERLRAFAKRSGMPLDF